MTEGAEGRGGGRREEGRRSAGERERGRERGRGRERKEERERARESSRWELAQTVAALQVCSTPCATAAYAAALHPTWRCMRHPYLALVITCCCPNLYLVISRVAALFCTWSSRVLLRYVTARLLPPWHNAGGGHCKGGSGEGSRSSRPGAPCSHPRPFFFSFLLLFPPFFFSPPFFPSDFSSFSRFFFSPCFFACLWRGG